MIKKYINKRVITTVAFLALSAAALFAVIRVTGASPAEAPTDLEKLLNEAERVTSALQENGYEMKQAAVERLTPLAYVDSAGNNVIMYYEYRLFLVGEPTGGLVEEVPARLREEVFDPDTAESSRLCQVGDVEGTLYQKDGLCYLWWSPMDYTILVLRYDPAAVTESDIVRMAESCKAQET